eukprot:CAMPEP_0184303390 /NCGR_PEP_ID=MMETSP1049-20130417/13147_1 /TAXON_ID=77928 /ORGANISM="Proteomonas sulcata, Strain CCMP704" /LENGTH=876 /DNA_ID=CAMNT_0026614923 /DNA_START=166 /DNA_END=2796 /DNA_ORIENTATION=+
MPPKRIGTLKALPSSRSNEAASPGAKESGGKESGANGISKTPQPPSPSSPSEIPNAEPTQADSLTSQPSETPSVTAAPEVPVVELAEDLGTEGHQEAEKQAAKEDKGAEKLGAKGLEESEGKGRDEATELSAETAKEPEAEGDQESSAQGAEEPGVEGQKHEESRAKELSPEGLGDEKPGAQGLEAEGLGAEDPGPEDNSSLSPPSSQPPTPEAQAAQGSEQPAGAGVAKQGDEGAEGHEGQGAEEQVVEEVEGVGTHRTEVLGDQEAARQQDQGADELQGRGVEGIGAQGAEGVWADGLGVQGAEGVAEAVDNGNLPGQVPATQPPSSAEGLNSLPGSSGSRPSSRDSKRRPGSQGSLRTLAPLPASSRTRDANGNRPPSPEKIDAQYSAVVDAGVKLKEFMSTVNEEEQDKAISPLVSTLLVPPQVLDLESKVEADEAVLGRLAEESSKSEAHSRDKLHQELKEATQKEGRSAESSAGPAKGELEREKVDPGDVGKNGVGTKEMSSPEGDDPTFQGVDKLQVFCGTWNMMGKPCPLSQSLHEWLLPGDFDLYAIGAQECEVPPQATSNVTERPKWEAQVKGTLGNSYSVIAKKCLGSTHLMCFIRSNLRAKVVDVQVAQVVAGFGNVMANKGGVAVCFDLFSTSFLFVSAHFAAHQKQIQARNSNFERIDAGLVPLLCPVIAATNAPANNRDVRDLESVEANPGSPRSKRTWSCSSLFDRVFWMGDFNYRLDTTIEVVVSKLKDHKREELLQYDQLKSEMKKGAVFKGFEEAPLAFDPTYKFKKYSTEYDAKKKRTPSWTDRILYRQPPGQKASITCKAYTAITSIISSDHRPVAGHFDVVLKALSSGVAPKESRSQQGDSPTKSKGSSACSIL